MVSEESKAFANTVFLKKSMYYNMRSRIVKRHAGHVIRKASESQRARFVLRQYFGRPTSLLIATGRSLCTVTMVGRFTTTSPASQGWRDLRHRAGGVCSVSTQAAACTLEIPLLTGLETPLPFVSIPFPACTVPTDPFFPRLGFGNI